MADDVQGHFSEYDLSFHHPDSVTSDESFGVAIDGLPHDEQVTVSVSMEDRDGMTWSSRASFAVDDGSLDLGAARLNEGEHTGSATMDLITTMEPTGDQENPYFGPERTQIEFEVSVDGTVLGTTDVTRHFSDPAVEAVDTADHLAGTLYEPPGDEPAPGVLLLHGGDGRPLERKARLLASNGFVALALKYFNFIGQNNPLVPNGLVDIPVEYVHDAIDWLLDRNRVAGGSVGIYGISKGGELGLLAASRNDDVGAVVSLNGSALVWEGFVYREDHPGSTWTIDGEQVPYVPWTDNHDWEEMSKPFELRSLYTESYERASAEQIEAATIPVHRIEGRVLFVTGGDDQMWHTARFNRHAIDLLEEHDCDYDHVLVEGAGHAILPPFRPTGNREEGYWVFGGGPEQYRKADRLHWNRTLETLGELRTE